MWKQNSVYTMPLPLIQLLFTDSSQLSTEKSTVVSNEKVRQIPRKTRLRELRTAIGANFAQDFGDLVVNEATLTH